MRYLNFVINHVFMPPRLPQKADRPECIGDLLSTVYDAIEIYRKKYATPEHEALWGVLSKMVDTLRQINERPAGGIRECVESMHPGDTIAIFIRAQNAGVMMRCGEDNTIFESFEVSPRNQDVMACTGKLVRSFPGPAIAVQNDIVQDPAFSEELAAFLTQMDGDSLEAAQVMTDTTHPRYITELLTGVLYGLGKPADIPRIRKRTSDDVLWDSAHLPWRRSPIWLVVRVALQTTIHRETSSMNEYKSFMVFFLAEILRLGVKESLPGHLLYCMRAKLSRRLFKIRSFVDPTLVTDVHEVVVDTERLLQERWKAVQDAQARAPEWAPDELDVVGDTSLTLTNAGSYISAALAPMAADDANAEFSPDHYPRLCDLPFEDLPRNLQKAVDADGYIALWDFECCVQDRIDNWVHFHTRPVSREKACGILSDCMTTYAQYASKLYARVPEQQSVMLLTLLELWRALDIVALKSCPLLNDYSPEIPLTLYEALLLRKAKPLERIFSIQMYLRDRYRKAGRIPRSVFSEVIDDKTFAVKFFNSSFLLQELKLRIEEQARAKRCQKLEELEELNREHGRKMELARFEAGYTNSLDHSFVSDTKHDSNCRKCRYERQAEAMTINIHEWPLPEDQMRAEIAVFELAVPQVFKTWRRTTYWLLYDICTPPLHREKVSPSTTLESYASLNSLSEFLAADSQRRISLASQEKSFLKSHYKVVKIPADGDKVCLRNALSYRLWDESEETWVHPPSENSSLGHRTTTQTTLLSPYLSLERFGKGTFHTSNDILASQHQCPQSLSLHEFIAFGSLRAGARLQWYNIAREIPSRNLSFNREEVYDLISRAACQIGCVSDDGVWEWHACLQDERFGDVLLDVLDQLGTDIEGNWNQSVTVLTINALVSRLLTSVVEGSVVDKAYRLLRKIRDITMCWLHELTALQSEVERESERDKYQTAICRTAATCRSTFDVDPFHAGPLLQTSEDVAIFIECAIIVQNYSPKDISSADPHLYQLLLQDQRLACSMEELLLTRVLERETMQGISSAMKSIWSSFHSTCSWRRLPEPNDRWLTTTVVGERAQAVYFNVLSGTLLIDGELLGRLPPEMVGHPMYKELFGEKNLDVVPSDMIGMKYVTRASVSCAEDGRQIIHFALRDKELILRSRFPTLGGENCRVSELLPRKIFKDDLPSILVDDCLHWLELSTCQVELRPKEAPWRSSSSNWYLRRNTCFSWTMDKEPSIELVDCRSRTAEMICAILRPLDASNNVLIMRSSMHELLVNLPRLQLSFTLKGGRLCSLDIPGFEIDHENQSTGTMLGLRSQLALRQSGDRLAHVAEPGYSRRVIIPIGRALITGDGDHVAVTIDHSGSRRVHYCDFDVDTLLGRLVGDGSLFSTLFQAYLHAITSYCLSDPLTFVSGIEEGLQILRSARCKSFQSLNDPERELLHQLSALTPSRNWYPPHLQVMQQTAWNKALSPIVQHDAFWREAQSIIMWGDQMQLFYPVVSIGDRHDTRQPHLLSRAGYRNAVWYGAGVPRDVSVDTVYESRDAANGLDVTRIRDTANVSKVCHCPHPLKTPDNLLSHIKSWREEIVGCSTDDSSGVRLGYSKEWLSLNMPNTWIPLYDACRSAGWVNILFKAAFSFSAMEYSGHQSKELISAFLAFARYPEFCSINPPSWPRYNFTMGCIASASQLNSAVMEFVTRFEDTQTYHTSLSEGIFGQRLKEYRAQVSSEVSSFVANLTDQWDHGPTNEPILPSTRDSNQHLIDTSLAMVRVTELFQSWFRNWELCNYIRQVQRVLDNRRAQDAPALPIYSFRTSLRAEEVRPSFVSYCDVFLRQPPSPAPPPFRAPLDHDNIKRLVSTLHSSADPLFRRYGNYLTSSWDALQNVGVGPAEILQEDQFRRAHQMCETHLSCTLEQIKQAMDPDASLEAPQEVMRVAGLWPKTTIRSLLCHLSASPHSRVDLALGWKNAFVCLAHSILLLQRWQRLIRLRHKPDEFLKEYQNNTDLRDISDRLDWLLVQIDSNFLIRPVQVEVARNMMFPRLQDNTIFQLNMGEGKSSVIVPLIATSLADGQKLVRIIVPKPLANQTFQLLVRRLGGLANRRIYCAPFSRAIAVKDELLQRMYHECMQTGGILVMQPEHILSFKLMGIYRQISAKAPDNIAPNTLLELQRWLDANVRDILDESDEILAVKYQLIYTFDAQEPLEHYPDRWTVVQYVFSVLSGNTQILEELVSHGGIELVQRRCGCFPRLRILKREAGDKLIHALVHGIMTGGSPDLPPLRLLRGRLRQEAMAFISERYPGELHELRNHYHGNGHIWNTLLLLRGLFAYGILAYVLAERRWRVDYGLDLTRSLLAVPYRAKDVPAPRAQFSHPDVCISLTCLSYYYGGLSHDQLDTCFELLQQLGDPETEYYRWIKDNCLVPQFRDYSSFNPDDHRQKIDHLYPAFERNQATINFFLSHVVFPREAKTFPQKLSTSGWDIAERRQHVTTGFSGTNDNRDLLPTSVTQDDIPTQSSTNVEVLDLIFRPENNHYRTADSSEFLDLVVEETPQIRVLLDVGAQILQYSNKELASMWLSRISEADADAAIFFSDDDEIHVIKRDGETERFISSSYRYQLDRCLVYLDDSHTRGTDLRLPINYRAAVTLGPKVTKDRLVQGCMRMRQLGRGQSVIFFAPPDVDRAIHRVSAKESEGQITAYDVVFWSITETCASLQRYSHHWREQGVHYTDRRCAWETFWSSGASDTSELKKYWLQPESKSLEEMYGPVSPSAKLGQESPHHPEADCREIEERSRPFSFSRESGLARLEEEEERELELDLEREQQIERPRYLPPAVHRLDDSVVSFVRSGQIRQNSPPFVLLFSSVVVPIPLSQQSTRWSRNLFATRDFVTTIKGLGTKDSIEFLRPVNWILSSNRDSTLVVCSPFEANELLPEIRGSSNTTLHVYSPRTGQSMKSFDDLKFYTIPSRTTWPHPESLTISQLNIFSGQLYFNDFHTYLEICNFLGVNTTHDEGNEIATEGDGFILPKNRTGETSLVCPFDISPLPFINRLTSARRKGMPYTSTHLGRIVKGAFVREEEF
ncbi:uncharacterized protein EI90DRAFT_3002306 [Cantharellus anzutake]|uniref:uncharacterized protein n=1 Tax=Cantharellus anzutake TaxID=1750568 RepID=UPI001902CD67|nr:uncharacterized protein EI90DRAFT_3002306 [Cantharellus anzutake]KAF8318597.1 hypothetical protein EI90DRAFT_3002306 [Cantharellus anzutake]